MLMIASLALILASFAGIVFVVMLKGFSALNLAMLLELPKGGYYLGKEGGIANAIVGSLYLSFGALIISLLLSLPMALALQKEYSNRYFSSFTRFVLDILWGTPSIVYGSFGFVIMMYCGLRASLLGGIIVLTFVMLPIMVRSMAEVIKMVPRELKEISYSLGTTKIETNIKVILRQSIPE